MDNKLLQHGAKSWFGLMTKVTERGGKAIVPPTDIAHIGRFSVFSDQQGAVISVITYFPHQP
jgi:predicted enzyme related to lactoylglutathione lyase